MKPMKLVTAEMLEKAEACAYDIRKFRREWPDGCKLTKKNCLRAFGPGGLGLAPDWAAEHLLSDEAWAEYEKAIDAAEVEHERARDAAVVEFAKDIDAVEVEYEKAMDAAEAEYERAEAIAFYDAAQFDLTISQYINI